MAGLDAAYKEIPKLSSDIIDSLLNKVDISVEKDNCWEWLGMVRSKNKRYGRFRIKKECFSAHRLFYFLFNKVDPKDLHVLHTCDNPSCVNPHHLFLGTNDDNVADKVKKNRQSRNVSWNRGKITKYRNWDNKTCKLTEEQFYEIKNLYAEGKLSLRMIGDKYGVSKPIIGKIIRRMGGDILNRNLLTVDKVIAIRNEYNLGGVTYPKLAEKYNVKVSTISAAVKGRNWKHVK